MHGLHQRLSQPADEIPPPLLSCQVVVYRFVKHPAFDWTILGLILVNVVVIIVELAAPISDDAKAKLKIVNYVFCTIYLVEVIFKVTAVFFVFYFFGEWDVIGDRVSRTLRLADTKNRLELVRHRHSRRGCHRHSHRSTSSRRRQVEEI